VNDESLERVNGFLAAVVARVAVGDVLTVTPAELGRELGFPDALSTARAVRALISRRRLVPAQGSYRLLDATPVGPEEREALERPRKARRRGPTQGVEAERGSGTRSMTYSDVGRAAVDRMIELGREAADQRAGLRSAREETRSARQARDEAEQRARALTERVRELEARAEMAESNLRTLLAQARAKEGPRQPSDVSDAEMEAILGVLKTGEAGTVEIPDAAGPVPPDASEAAVPTEVE
jgi:hypothetical protein